MSDDGALLRNPDALITHQQRIKALLEGCTPLSPEENLDWSRWKLRDLLRTQQAIIDAMLCAASLGSSGSGAIRDDRKPTTHPALDFGIRPQAATSDVLVTQCTPQGCASHWEPRRLLPERDLWFETVWRQYRQRNAPKGERN
jgi:hypothetical protein